MYIYYANYIIVTGLCTMALDTPTPKFFELFQYTPSLAFSTAIEFLVHLQLAIFLFFTKNVNLHEERWSVIIATSLVIKKK